MSSVVNISAYKFITLGDLPALRETLLEHTLQHGLKGTILLAEEGINLFLAGAQDALDAFVSWLRSDARFADMEPKYSWSDTQPFGKMLVKIKREIIRMNHPSIRPENGRAPVVDAPTLARWLAAGQDDAGREVVMLDTRNDFEVDAGTFEGAVDWRLEKFSQFPEALQAHRAEFEGKTVVGFCTGGIRCEKAVIYMQEIGMENVYQLEGGILKYFELAGGQSYQGNCFVFDERETLDAALAPSR
ncbi:sulfurtransferase [Corticimicrobacter populi]|uniref:tRNA uridine(34) hydroxylase n=1 Tax=Corticimicrobacter populi TaxID=2175229 RepID=A0A2V1K2Y1_9BURK|nr:sulfurtransferase [Corticimicrobacter populi]PWF23291.1 sulfurtransferase [Corticimicrobacter populi]